MRIIFFIALSVYQGSDAGTKTYDNVSNRFEGEFTKLKLKIDGRKIVGTFEENVFEYRQRS